VKWKDLEAECAGHSEALHDILADGRRDYDIGGGHVVTVILYMGRGEQGGLTVCTDTTIDDARPTDAFKHLTTDQFWGWFDITKVVSVWRTGGLDELPPSTVAKPGGGE
jgi:hypothetical protein